MLLEVMNEEKESKYNQAFFHVSLNFRRKINKTSNVAYCDPYSPKI